MLRADRSLRFVIVDYSVFSSRVIERAVGAPGVEPDVPTKDDGVTVRLVHRHQHSQKRKRAESVSRSALVWFSYSVCSYWTRASSGGLLSWCS